MQPNEIALPIGTILHEYKIEGILGVGGFGITYLAIDINLEKKVVIKEFLPNDIAVRKDSDTVVPKSHSDKENFEWGMSRFLLEAKTLAKFNHPNIVKISRFFEANNTAYFVMDYEEGEDLQEYFDKHNKQLSEEEIYNIIMPILDGLREVHSHNFLHRDIKPGNIFIRKNGSPMLIDFGASRFAMGVKSKSLSVVLTEGYAPKEQYSSTSKQGPYTDIYAIGAVMYKMATGKTPIEASARVDATSDDEPDPYVKLQDQNIPYSDNFKKAVDSALELSAKNRPQSVKELQDLLMEKVQVVSKEDDRHKINKISKEENIKMLKTKNNPNKIDDKILLLLISLPLVFGVFFGQMMLSLLIIPSEYGDNTKIFSSLMTFFLIIVFTIAYKKLRIKNKIIIVKLLLFPLIISFISNILYPSITSIYQLFILVISSFYYVVINKKYNLWSNNINSLVIYVTPILFYILVIAIVIAGYNII